jgi:hypothetical protein
MLPEREAPMIQPGSGICVEETTTRDRMSLSVAESELLAGDTALRLMQGVKDYK